MQAAAKANQLSLFAVQEAVREGSILHVSKSALLAFRVFTNLAKRTGKGFVRSIQSLLPMLGVSERRAWQLIAELKAAGWISWTPVRERGQRGIEFAPLVKLPKVSRGRFAPRARGSNLQAGAAPQRKLPVVQPAFSCPEVAPSIALSNAKSCTLDRGTPLKTSPVGTEDDNRQHPKNEMPTLAQTDPVAVSLLENVVSTHEAQELAREASKKALTTEQIERVIAAYRGQQEKIRNRGAWLREAIRRGFAPVAPAATHASDLVGSAPVVKAVKVKIEQYPTVQPGAELLAASRCPSLRRILAARKQGAK